MRIESSADLVLLLGRGTNIVPDRTSLLREVTALTSDEMMQQIARSDYGNEAELHLEALRFIRGGRPVAQLPWHPREVLELARWSLPERGGEAPEFETEHGHAIRLFACSVLLVVDATPMLQRNEHSENMTLAALLDSLLALSRKSVMFAAASHVLFRFNEGLLQPEDRPFFALGLLTLLLSACPQDLKSEDWECLTTWVIEEEANSRSASGYVSGPWLLGSTYYDSRHGLWRRLGERLLRMPHVAGTELLMAGLSEW